uniref:Uncharacterized protein n=1 Tax=Drosophila-associated filamentous virus TaxID=2743186 RepID=A0A6M9U0X8_9VIRU|nr:putative protein 38 [Drosophila-associated filamentous virus]
MPDTLCTDAINEIASQIPPINTLNSILRQTQDIKLKLASMDINSILKEFSKIFDSVLEMQLKTDDQNVLIDNLNVRIKNGESLIEDNISAPLQKILSDINVLQNDIVKSSNEWRADNDKNIKTLKELDDKMQNIFSKMTIQETLVKITSTFNLIKATLQAIPKSDDITMSIVNDVTFKKLSNNMNDFISNITTKLNDSVKTDDFKTLLSDEFTKITTELKNFDQHKTTITELSTTLKNVEKNIDSILKLPSPGTGSGNKKPGSGSGAGSGTGSGGSAGSGGSGTGSGTAGSGGSAGSGTGSAAGSGSGTAGSGTGSAATKP